MNKKELMKLPTGKLVGKLISTRANYQQLANNYRDLKADVILIKKQLENICNNIQIGPSWDRSRFAVRYYKSGKENKKTLNLTQKARFRKTKIGGS